MLKFVIVGAEIDSNHSEESSAHADGATAV